MKKILAIVLSLVILLSLTGCVTTSSQILYKPKEQPHLYWKDIDVVVTDIDRKHWYASTHWYVVKITVKSEEYGLIEEFEIKGSGAFGRPNQWNYKRGQIVKAQLYSWVMDNTGDVVRREINKVY